MRVIFMGTPEFAVESLKKLVENQINVVAVITAPDKPKGRGKSLGTSPVKDYAVSQDLTVLQPTNLKSEKFLEELNSYKADIQVVVAFRMLPELVWNMPPKGTFNLHASLLPQYRGAAPINWAIINGESKTGITTFFLQHEIDTGKIIFQEEEEISKNDTVGDLYERLMLKGADLVIKTVRAIESSDYKEKAQDDSKELRHAPKIFKETCEIDWNDTAENIRNFVRGLSPYPGAWTKFDDKTMKIYQVSNFETETETEISLVAGEVSTGEKNKMLIGTGNGLLSIENVQLQGKRRMSTQDFLAGNGALFNENSKLG